MVDLLGCPFCGDIPSLRQSRDHFIISCRNDGCRVNSLTSSRFDAEVVEEWNRRAGVAATAGSAGAMREALSEWVAQGYIDADGDHCGSAAYAPDLYAKSIAALSAAAPQAQEDELYRIRDLIASHIACEKDCQEMPSGCGCALTAARAVVSRPERGEPNGN